MTALQQREEERAMDVFFNVFERLIIDIGDKELEALAPLMQSGSWQRELARMFKVELDYRNELID